MPRHTIESLPNIGSPHQTSASLAIDIHYFDLKLLKRWDWARFVKLCTFLKMTEYEIASLVLLPHAKIPPYRKMRKLPAPLVGHALILTLLEAYLMRGLTADLIENPFPDLTKTT